MTLPNHRGRFLAIVAGAAFVAGGLTILLGESLTHPLEWAAYQWLTILTVGGTIAAGHLMSTAARARHLFAALGFFVLFLSGTGLVVYSSVGRQVETAGVQSLSAEDTNKRIVEKSADLDSARARKAYADAQVQREMTGQRCGTRCKDWQTNSRDVSVVIHQLEAEIAALGPQKPVNAQAAALADMAALFGFENRAKTIAALTLIAPFLKTLFFEIGSIVSLGFAFRSGPRTFSARKSTPEIMPPKPRQRFPANVVQLPAKHPVRIALEKNGGSVASNRELARLMDVSDGEASKRWQEIEHLLDVEKVGKQLSIALRKLA